MSNKKLIIIACSIVILIFSLTALKMHNYINQIHAAGNKHNITAHANNAHTGHEKPAVSTNVDTFTMPTNKEDYLKVVNKNANASKPIFIKTYEGYNQPMHPDILHIPEGFHGFKYWLAYTPYPYMMDKFENPCIAASNDSINWVAPRGIKNPIAPPPTDSRAGGHFSDTDIIYDNGKLVTFFVYNKRGVMGPSKFYRSISGDGVKWSAPELIYTCNNPISGYCPAIVKENDTYKMWYTSEGNIMSYVSSTDCKNWTAPQKCDLNINGWSLWHVNITKTDLGYEGLMCARDNTVKNRAVFYILSKNGINWTHSKLPVIYPSENGWDNREIYRSAMLKENGVYRVWYSAVSMKKRWGIGYAEGTSIEDLKGLDTNTTKPKV